MRPPRDADPERLAGAVEALEAGRVPEGETLREALELLQAAPGVRTQLRRRRALRKWAQLWATGEYATRSAVDERVAAHVHSTPATVRWWRCWLAPLFPNRAPETVSGQGGT